MVAEPTPLERQQLDLVDPSAHTFWHWVRFAIVAGVAEERGAVAVADIGAGSGMLGDRLAHTHENLRYRFDELSPALDAALIERWGDESRIGPEEIIGADTVVAMLDVIEHIEDDVGALREWHARMEVGTRLVVTVPALQWAFSQWDIDLGHFRRYSRRTLRRSLESAGFSVERCDYLFPEMLPLVVKRRFAPSSNTSADMPLLGDRTNRIGNTISSATARVRRIWPAGTSVVAIAERR
jgi:hypothetical protein